MARKADTRRYAQAVFEIAHKRQELDEWQSDLTKIASLSADVAFVALLENPKLPFAAKARLLSERLYEVNPLALNLVYLLVMKGRLRMVSVITEEYQRLLNRYRGIELAEVMTAVPLGDEEKLVLAKRLEAIVGKKVMVKSEVDAGLLGGVVVRIEGKLLDGSTRSQLEALKKELRGVGG